MILDHPGLLPGHFVVIGPSQNLLDLASHDEVAYIPPASMDLLSGQPVTPCPGALTGAGVVSQYVEASSGWAKDSDGSAHLGYAFQSLSPKLDTSAEQSELIRALAEWAATPTSVGRRERILPPLARPKTISPVFALFMAALVRHR